MKKDFLNSIKIVGIALVIGLGVSYVSAFTSPVGNPPVNNVPAPINTGTVDQTKDGGILSEKFFLSDLSFFTKMLLPSTDSWLNIGGDAVLDPTGISNGGSTIPLTFDMNNRATVTRNGTQGKDAINFISGQAACSTATTFVNDSAPAFEFTSSTTANVTGHADLIARQLKLAKGSPQDNSVLASVDSQGNAVWAHLVIQGGVVKVVNNQTGSPVVTDASCGPAQATYTWVKGTWGACTPTSPGVWRDFYGSGPMSTVGQSCTAWINANASGYNVGTQTRNVTCQDSSGNTVADSFCDWATKPAPLQTCTVPIQVRVKITTDNLGTQTINYTDPGQCLYAKLLEPTNPDPLANMFPLGCQVRTTSQSTPTGFQPSAYCYLMSFSGGPGYGFNAGNPGGWTATGSATWTMQVKQ